VEVRFALPAIVLILALTSDSTGGKEMRATTQHATIMQTTGYLPCKCGICKTEQAQ